MPPVPNPESRAVLYVLITSKKMYPPKFFFFFFFNAVYIYFYIEEMVWYKGLFSFLTIIPIPIIIYLESFD